VRPIGFYKLEPVSPKNQAMNGHFRLTTSWHSVSERAIPFLQRSMQNLSKTVRKCVFPEHIPRIPGRAASRDRRSWTDVTDYDRRRSIRRWWADWAKKAAEGMHVPRSSCMEAFCMWFRFQVCLWRVLHINHFRIPIQLHLCDHIQIRIRTTNSKILSDKLVRFFAKHHGRQQRHQDWY